MAIHLAHLVVCLSVSLSFPAWSAVQCETDTISAVRDAGARITMVKGRLFEPLGQDFIDPSRWRPQEQITICAEPPVPLAPSAPFYKLTNLSRGETLVVLDVKDGITRVPLN